MRKYLRIFIVAVAFLAWFLLLTSINGCTTAAQGEARQIMPEELRDWRVIEAVPTEPGLYMVSLRNPDPYSEVKIVLAIVSDKSVIFGYRYFRGPDAYDFKLDFKTGKWIGGLLSGKEKKACAKCHKQLKSEII